MAINGAFRFHAVGQGLFYSGLITDASRGRRGTFSFVYDCGTTSSKKFLLREIDDLKELLQCAGPGRKRLDLLVVSHMHDDHVNGLEYLLDGLEVDTVVMPYVGHAIRLLARAESDGEDPFLSHFYADPVDWFSSRGVRRIMLVGAPGDDSPGIDGIQRHDDEEGLTVDRDDVLSYGRAGDTPLLFLRNDARAMCHRMQWRFSFRNLEHSGRASYLGVLERFQREKMLSLDDIFRSRRLTRELARRLREGLPKGKTVNRTSVVMTHEPILGDGDEAVFWPSCGPWPCDRAYPKCCRADEMLRCCRRTTLTGDVEVRDKGERDQLWENDVAYAVFQYPHHGAARALPSDVLGAMPRGWLPVVSAGIANRYGHPHTNVLGGWRGPVVVDERVAFDYRMMIEDHVWG